MSWDFQLLQRVLSHPIVNTIKSIPPSLRRPVAVCVAEIFDLITRNPENPVNYVSLFLFPRAVLRNVCFQELSSFPRRRRQHIQLKFVQKRLETWKLGGIARFSLIHDILDEESHQHPEESTLASNIRRCDKIARQDGQYRKALQALKSNGVAPASPETTQLLRDKHPEGQPIQLVMEPTQCLEITSDIVLAQLAKFSKGVGCGRSGWRVNHFLECSKPQIGLPEFLDNLTSFINLCLEGKALQSFATFMSSAPLVPLLKKDDSIRPIAVGEVLRRLISKCCVHAVVKDISAILSPLQLGVGIQFGAEAILHSLNRSHLDDTDNHTDTVIACLDFKNAFNMVDRSNFFVQVSKFCPTILAWVQYTYGTGATIFSEKDIIIGSAGVNKVILLVHFFLR
jgi:hypothetical protein